MGNHNVIVSDANDCVSLSKLSKLSVREERLREEGTHPSFKASKTDAPEDKEALTQTDTLWGVYWIRKGSGATRDNRQGNESEGVGITSVHQTEEEKLWGEVVGHLVRGGSFERSACYVDDSSMSHLGDSRALSTATEVSC